jgi:hypothetical protein
MSIMLPIVAASSSADIPAKTASPRRPQLLSSLLHNWVMFLALFSWLTVPSASQAQQCSCSDQRVDQACTIEDKISDPFGLVQTITKQSTCSVLKRVCSGACEANLTGGLPTVGGTCSSLLQAARETQQRVSNVRRDVWSKVHSAAQNIGVDTTRDVVLYNLAAQASFTYNAYAGTAWYQVTMPAGLKVEEGKVKSNLHGDYNVPDVDPKQVISQGGFIETKIYSGYEDWATKKKSQSNQYVYVASKRFVETVALENIAQQVGWAIVTYGQTAAGSIETLKEQLVLEWADILKWLAEVGVDSSQMIAADIAKALLENGLKNGKIEIPASSNLPSISADVEVIYYEYEAGPSLSGEMKPILSLIGYDEGKAKLVPRVRVPHLAFSFSIGKPGQSASHYEQLFANFAQLLKAGPVIDIGAIADEVGKMTGMDLGKARSFKEVDGSGSIRSAFADALSEAVAEAKKRHKGAGLFDFTDSGPAKQLEANLRGLMVGNSKDAKVARLAIDVSSATVSLDVDLTSKHVLLKLDILKELGALWKSKDEGETKLFNDALALAKSACEKAAQACKSLPGPSSNNSQICGDDVKYDDLTLEPLSRPVPMPGSMGSNNYEVPTGGKPAAKWLNVNRLSVADPVLTMIPPVVGLTYRAGSSGVGFCHGVAVGGRYILVATPPHPIMHDACRNFQDVQLGGLPWQSRPWNPLTKTPVQTHVNFVLLEAERNLRGTTTLSDENPKAGEPVVAVSVLSTLLRKDCRVGANPTDEFFDLECPSDTASASDWIFSRRTGKLLGFSWSPRSLSVTKFVASSP